MLGAFEVEVVYSCESGREGSEFAIEVAGQSLVGTSRPTGSWATFSTETIGTLRIDEAGLCTLAVKPRTPPAWKVIGLRSITLRPAR